MPALELLAAWPSGAAGSIVSAAGLEETRGRRDEVVPLASVTKLVTALAVHVAVEEGTLALDRPAGPPGSTVAHLLSHASGLVDGEALPHPVGSRRVYSNRGYETLAAELERAAGMPATDYVAAAVLEPLGMTREGLGPATSWAHGYAGSLADLEALATELLHPTLVSREGWEAMRSVAFPALAGVVPGWGRFDPCPWGLGPEVRGAKAPHWAGSATSPATFGHFGQSGAFLWVDPVSGIAAAVVSGRDFGPWAKEAWPALSDAVAREASE